MDHVRAARPHEEGRLLDHVMADVDDDVGRADRGEDHDSHDPGPRARPPAPVAEHDRRDAGDHQDGVEKPRIVPRQLLGHAAEQRDRVHPVVREDKGRRGHGDDHECDKQVRQAANPVTARCRRGGRVLTIHRGVPFHLPGGPLSGPS